MDKEKKGLVDDQDGDFILNESSTSVNIDPAELETNRTDELNKTDKSREDLQKSEGLTNDKE
jgi:hypothetical protein